MVAIGNNAPTSKVESFMADGFDLFELPPLGHAQVTSTEIEKEAQECLTEVRSSSSTTVHARAFKEWVPPMIRMVPAFSLAACLWLCAAALYGIDLRVRTSQGISTTAINAVNALHYLPTVAAILLGFAWKSLLTDVKRITPWSAISGKWAKCTESIFLNYIDDNDFESVYVSFRHRHWALFLILLGALLSGLLVPLANSLTYQNLSLTVTDNVTLHSKTTFTYNGSLETSPSYRSLLPGASYRNSIASARSANYPAWTYDKWAFESFQLPVAHPSARDVLVNATVKAFTSTLECEHISFNSVWTDDIDGQNSTIALSLDTGTYPGLRCPSGVRQSVKLWFNSSTVGDHFPVDDARLFTIEPFGWSNVSDCGTQDWVLLYTIMNVEAPQEGDTNRTAKGDVRIRTSGLACRPHHLIYPAYITVNYTNERIMWYDIDLDKPQDVEIGVTSLSLQALLQEPLTKHTGQIFTSASTNEIDTNTIPNSYDWEVFPTLSVFQTLSWLYLYGPDQTPGSPYLDQFFSMFAGSSSVVLRYLDDVDSFISKVNLRYSRMLAQMMNFDARSADEGVLTGGVMSSNMSRMVIRRSSLYAIQAILVVLGLILELSATILRPRTALMEDPSSIGAIAVLLAGSSENELLLCGHVSVSEQHHRSRLSKAHCRLTSRPMAPPTFEIRDVEQAPALPLDIGRTLTSLSSPGQHTNVSKVPGSRIFQAQSQERRNHGYSYRPLALRAYARIALILMLTAFVLTLCILLALSKTDNGFAVRSIQVRDLWAYLPTLLLVVVGYCIQGLEKSAATMERYNLLSRNRSDGWKTVASSGRRSRLQHPSRVTKSSFVTMALLLSMVTYPIAKIVLAGVFRQTFANTNRDITGLEIDTTAISGFEQVLMETHLTHAAAAQDWVSRELVKDFNVPRTPFATDELFMPELTQNPSALLDIRNETELFDTINLQVSTIGLVTEIQCASSEDGDFNINLDCFEDTYQFSFACATSGCTDKYGNSTSVIPVTFNHTGNGESYYFTSIHTQAEDYLTVIVADFSPLNSLVNNTVSDFCSNHSHMVSELDRHDITPIISAANCTRKLNRAEVSVTMAPVPEGLAVMRPIATAGAQTDWMLVGYDSASVKVIDQIVTNFSLLGMSPNSGNPTVYFGRSLAPPISFTGTTSLISQAQEFLTGDARDVLDPKHLAASTKLFYEKFTKWVLTMTMPAIQFHTLPAVYAVYPESQVYNGSGFFKIPAERIKQDAAMTAAVVVCLIVVLVVILALSTIIPYRTMLPRPPSSIAAQMSLVAGSTLVQMLREERVMKTSDSQIWANTFGLGWWSKNPIVDRNPTSARCQDMGTHVSMAEVSSKEEAVHLDEERGSRTVRWGVDIGLLDRHQNMTPSETGGWRLPLRPPKYRPLRRLSG